MAVFLLSSLLYLTPFSSDVSDALLDQSGTFTMTQDYEDSVINECLDRSTDENPLQCD